MFIQESFQSIYLQCNSILCKDSSLVDDSFQYVTIFFSMNCETMVLVLRIAHPGIMLLHILVMGLIIYQCKMPIL